MADVSILGADAVRGDADALHSVAGFLDAIAQQLHDVRATLQQRTFNDIWEGASAQAFSDLLGHTPPDLAKAETSYTTASEALSGYVGQLRTAHWTAQNLANQLAALQQQSTQLEGSTRTANQNVSSARASLNHAADPSARAVAQHTLDTALRALSNLQGQHNSVQGQIGAIRRQAADNRRSLDAAARLAGDRLHQASLEGIRNPSHAWLHKGLEVIADPFIKTWELGGDLRDWIADPSAAKFSKLLDDVSSALTVVAIIAAVVAGAALIFFSGGAATPFVVAAAMEIGAYARFATAGVDSLKLGVDLGRRATGDTSVSAIDLVADTASIGVDMIGLKTPHEAVGNWPSAIRNPELPANWKTWAANCMVSGDGKPLSWKELNTINPLVHAVEPELRHYAAEVIIDQAKDLGDRYVPYLGHPGAELPSWLRTPSTRVDHTITVPIIGPVPAEALAA